jgi:2-isopropylmalate synthase
MCDGTRGEGIYFSLEDKLACVRLSAALGFDFVEGGYALPFALGRLARQDAEFFRLVKNEDLGNTKVVAFGLLPRELCKPAADPGVLALLDVEMEWVSGVGKASRQHVEKTLGLRDFGAYVRLMEESVRLLTKEGRQVIFLAEQFFDGYKQDHEFALEVLKAARAGGAVRLVLCDTNGGALPHEVGEVVSAVRARLQPRKGEQVPVGFHGHNAGDLAVANSLAAVLSGATHVQGTVNGLGEQCGNTDLVSVAANLGLKMGFEVLAPESMGRLTELSRFVYQKLNLNYRTTQPFVGESAFAHKGGLVLTALRKLPKCYEHVPPESVGNRRRLLVSDLSDDGLLREKLERFGLQVAGEERVALQKNLYVLQEQGWQFDAADATFYLLVLKHLNRYQRWFEPEHYCVLARGNTKPVNGDPKKLDADDQVEASVKIKVNGTVQHVIREGHGPVNALDLALREALRQSYPRLDEMELKDYAVRVIDGEKNGTAARVRVMIRWEDSYHKCSWGAVAVSDNIVAASWLALVDALDFKHLLDAKAVWPSLVNRPQVEEGDAAA